MIGAFEKKGNIMPDTKKQQLFEETLKAAYDGQRFQRFLQELLNDAQMLHACPLQKAYGSMALYVHGHRHLGNYTAPDGKHMALFAIELKRASSVENARSAQRAFIKSLLDASGADGALAAFYTMEDGRPSDKWRLSLIRMEFGFADGKISQQLTPAKRYSYLVGKDEPCHTAMERLYPLFAQDEENPTLDALEEAFSVEAVTRKFYVAYHDKYLELKEYLEGNADFMAEARAHGFTSEQFTKKLMGQIVFLYFIQKKGWLGVPAFPTRMTEKEYNNARFFKSKTRPLVERVYHPGADGAARVDQQALFALTDDEAEQLSQVVRGGAWGDGPKNFMRKLFESCVARGKNYFDDYLEPLFYEALNVNRGESGFFARFHCRVPFLNGGLFEQMDNYDWQHSDFCIPNALFSNAAEKGQEADGILDTFDRYNFTMAEDEPMEREVAIDPEMLGKVFENLLDVKDRKSKGAFYTPRAIVHYMCQESLVNYLTTATGIPEPDIRKFILYGEYFRDSDTKKTKRILEGGKPKYVLDKERKLEMPETIFSFRQHVNRLKDLDDLLAGVRVADPAVGSGAFLLGMLNEIVRARQTLTAYMGIEMNRFERLNFYAYGRKPYDLKVQTIKNCLFACDIEPSAVDITKLRLWLSIVIDDEIAAEDTSGGLFNEHTKPRQLPNLECNVICGNSLMDAFDGVRLITESRLLHNQTAGTDTFYQAEFDEKLKQLIALQDELFGVKDHAGKLRIKRDIQQIYDDIILHQLAGNPGVVADYEAAREQASKPFVLWQLQFPRVFVEKQGFDIAIGNPPYISAPNQLANPALAAQREALKARKRYKTLHSKWDLYIPFMELGLQLLHEDGSFAMIVPYPLENQIYGKKMREMLVNDVDLVEIVDLQDVKVFEATVQNVIPIAIKRESRHESRIANMIDDEIRTVFVQPHEKLVQDKKSGVWNLTQEKREANRYAAFHVLGDYCYLSYGLRPNSDEKVAKGLFKKKDLISDVEDGVPRRKYVEAKFTEKYKINKIKYLEYGTERSPGMLTRPTFPELYSHPKLMFNVLGDLQGLLDDHLNLVHNHSLMACVLWKDLVGVENKSISSSIKKFSRYDRSTMEELSRHIDLKFLLGVMNSQTAVELLKDARAGDYHIYPEHLRNIPIPDASAEEQQEIAALVDAVMEAKRRGDAARAAGIAEEIDEKVARLYARAAKEE